jgi:hypothetical protein
MVRTPKRKGIYTVGNHSTTIVRILSEQTKIDGTQNRSGNRVVKVFSHSFVVKDKENAKCKELRDFIRYESGRLQHSDHRKLRNSGEISY